MNLKVYHANTTRFVNIQRYCIPQLDLGNVGSKKTVIF